jgi:hypothetical protein
MLIGEFAILESFADDRILIIEEGFVIIGDGFSRGRRGRGGKLMSEGGGVVGEFLGADTEVALVHAHLLALLLLHPLSLVTLLVVVQRAPERRQ